MTRLQIKGTQIQVPNTVGAASSFSNATCVRLVNNGNSGRTITVATDQSGSTTIGTFSLLAGQTEYLEKNPWEVV